MLWTLLLHLQRTILDNSKLLGYFKRQLLQYSGMFIKVIGGKGSMHGHEHWLTMSYSRGRRLAMSVRHFSGQVVIAGQ